MKSIKQMNTKLFGLGNNLKNLIDLFDKGKLPSKILLCGPKGVGKCTTKSGPALSTTTV